MHEDRREETSPPDSPLDRSMDVADLPESPASLPSAALAAHAAPSLEDRGRVDREIWQLAWPAMLSMVMASLVSLIDIAMIGRLGTEALAGVGYVSQYFWLGQSVLFAIGIACVALMAQAIGAGEPARARPALGAALALALAAAVVLSAIALAIPVPLLMALDAPDEVIELIVPYFRLTLGSSVLFSVSIVIESALRAAKDTRTPMWIAGIMTVVKTVLNVLLIFGLFGFPRLELVGAGLATLIAQAVALMAFVYVSRIHRLSEALRLRRGDLTASVRLLPEVARIALPAVAERVILNVAILAYFALLGNYGAGVIAAYTVGVRILAFSWIPGIGFSTAASTLVGQALGAGDLWGARRAGWRSARFALGVSIILGGAYALGRNFLAQLFTDDPRVVQELGPFMLILALSQPFMGVHFTLGGALRGAGDTVTPLFSAALGNWGFRVPVAFVASRLLDLEVLYVWLALMMDHFARAVWLTLAFRSGRWATPRQGKKPRASVTEA